MILPAVVLGLFLIGVALYTVSDPMSRARNWVDGREWQENPQAAREEQTARAISMAYFVGMLGLLFVVLGLVMG
jgi:hypothetical protein